MVEVGGKPVLWHIMKGYAHYGYRDFVLCLGYRGYMIKEYFLNYEAMNTDFTIRLGEKSQVSFNNSHEEQDFQVTLADTGQETLTGGRVKRVEQYVDSNTFMVTYGDGLANVDIHKLVAFHRSHGKIATVTAVRPPSRFGVLEIGQSDQVPRFIEKPILEGYVNAGFFVFDRRIFRYLHGDDCVLEKTPLEELAAEGELMAYRHGGFFFAMDTYREYVHLNQLWSSGHAPWRTWK
jgi:glucose-1-phosphate cytidylyltransferase